MPTIISKATISELELEFQKVLRALLEEEEPQLCFQVLTTSGLIGPRKTHCQAWVITNLEIISLESGLNNEVKPVVIRYLIDVKMLSEGLTSYDVMRPTMVIHMPEHTVSIPVEDQETLYTTIYQLRQIIGKAKFKAP